MWKLLKEEISYNSIITLAVTMVLLQIILYSISSFYENINLLVMMMFSIIVLSIIIDRNRTGADRQISVLPLKNYSIGLSRALMILSSWIFLLPLLYLLNYLLLPAELNSSLILIGQLGFILVLISLFVVLRDLFMTLTNHSKIFKYLLSSFYLILLLIGTGIIFIIVDYYDPQLFSGHGIIFIYAWGVLLLFFTMITFSKRKSYLG